MNERLKVLSTTDGETGGTIGDNYRYFTLPTDFTVIFAMASPGADQATQTIDINDDGTGVIEGIACATAATPGTWKSTHMGGTNAPVTIAAGSKISLDCNNNTDTNAMVHVEIWGLVGEVMA